MQGNTSTKLSTQCKNNTDIVTFVFSNSDSTNLLSNNVLLISPEEIFMPEINSNYDKEILIEKNKDYFLGYDEKNKLLKLKLQELNQKKNKNKRCLKKLEKKNKNGVICKEKKEIVQKNKNIIDELLNLNNNMYINKKRVRKTKCQFTYQYECTYKNCGKKYSSQSSLNQHIKLKHH